RLPASRRPTPFPYTTLFRSLRAQTGRVSAVGHRSADARGSDGRRGGDPVTETPAFGPVHAVAPVPVLAMRDVHKSFGRGIRTTPVLHGIDLEITAGSSLGIVGESGAGNTTILSLPSPTSGTIEFNGAPLRRGRVGRMSEFRRAVQLVFQDPRSSLNPRMSVGRIIREPLESLDIPGDHRARVADLLESVGLEPG